MEIKINKCAKSCSACKRDFVHDEEFISRLDPREEEDGLFRRDFCRDCWDADSDRPKPYSLWSPRYYDPKVADPEEQEVFSPLRQLFYEAVGSESRSQHAKAFLAAQLLRRQKVFRLLKESDERDGEVSLLLYTDRIGSRLIEVRDPSFSYAELEDARKALLERLRELETPDPEEANVEGENEASEEQAAPETAEDGPTDAEEDAPEIDEVEDEEEVAHAAKQNH